MFIEKPEGFAKVAENGTKLECKLDKTLYVLKQASKNWHDRLKTSLLDGSFQKSKTDYCLYVKRKKHSLQYVLVWLDDIIVANSV